MSDYTAVRAVLKGWKFFNSDLQMKQDDTKFGKYWARAKGIENKYHPGRL
jgi:hypothetical protein